MATSSSSSDAESNTSFGENHFHFAFWWKMAVEEHEPRLGYVEVAGSPLAKDPANARQLAMSIVPVVTSPATLSDVRQNKDIVGASAAFSNMEDGCCGYVFLADEPDHFFDNDGVYKSISEFLAAHGVEDDHYDDFSDQTVANPPAIRRSG